MSSTFKENEFRKHLQNDDYKSVFWAGNSRSLEVEAEIRASDIAEDICEEQNNLVSTDEKWKTLEMQLKEAKINTSEFTDDNWERASEIFAEEARGNVCVIKGEYDYRIYGTFNETEREILISNENVNSYVEFIDPATRESQFYHKYNLPGANQRDSAEEYFISKNPQMKENQEYLANPSEKAHGFFKREYTVAPEQSKDLNILGKPKTSSNSGQVRDIAKVQEPIPDSSQELNILGKPKLRLASEQNRILTMKM